MIRLVVVFLLVTTAVIVPRTAAIGDPETANEFAGWYQQKFAPPIFQDDDPTTTTTTTTTTTRSASYVTDFNWACYNASQAESKLFGDQAQNASCLCDSAFPSIDCSYGDPIQHADAGGNYSVQKWYYWAFDPDSGNFQYLSVCDSCNDGDCLENTTVYDSACHFLRFYGEQEPTSCAVSFASQNWEAYQDCQICTDADGWYGVTPTSDEYWQLDEGSECSAYPFTYNPFPEPEPVPESVGSKIRAVVGSIISVVLFVVTGGGMYYFLFTGACLTLPCRQCPRLPCRKCPQFRCCSKLSCRRTSKDREGPTHDKQDGKPIERVDTTETDSPDP
jgi:hypothetical protein